MVGWGDFVDWLGGGAEAQALAAFLSFAVTVALVGVTVAYVRTNHLMLQEMREQGLSADRPSILVKLTDQRWEKSTVEPEESITIYDLYPEELQFTVHNHGPGPAVDAEAIVFHPKMPYYRHRKEGYILEKADWRFSVSTAEIYKHSRGQPATLGDWLKDQGIAPAQQPNEAMGLVVRYKDIHGRMWGTFMSLEYESHVAYTDHQTGKLSVGCWLEQGNQQIHRIVR